MNAYAYVKGDPVNSIDPSGHSALTVWLRAVGRFRLSLRGIRARAENAVSRSIGQRQLESLPDLVMQKIVRFIPGHDLVALASTSKTMNRHVLNNTYSLEDKNIARLPGAHLPRYPDQYWGRVPRDDNLRRVNVLRRARLGVQDGVLPGQTRDITPSRFLNYPDVTETTRD
ncbi:hypothetical protein L4923_26595 [Mesorhizobium sp. IRAMC:0171]|uniref:F-box domain-containing protein n=2 Tax=Mesorhizobium retamae TaxID=2912854 RepID=A0ABS9QMH7_9HYPH|nr:hypothetical protein [Mesorhizobium sp. IRAMC:0171]